MKVTNDLIEQGESRNGGWSKEQFECLGVSWPPLKGWKERVIGKEIPPRRLERFLRLKDKHLPPLEKTCESSTRNS